MYIDVVCSWCNKRLSTKVIGDGIYDKLRVTHSICPECKDKVMMEYKKDLRLAKPEQKQKIHF